MDRLEYEYLQEAFRRKLHRENGYMSENKEEIYREGILSAMSILSDHQKRYSGADLRENVRGEWIEHSYTYIVKCSVCDAGSQSKSNFCPNCGADMRKADRLYSPKYEADKGGDGE